MTSAATTSGPSSSSSASSSRRDGTARPRPPRGPSATVVAIELRRLSRNRRTVVFTLLWPVLFFFLFGKSQSDPAARVYVLVSLAVYGAMVATTAGGASVSVERAQGWTRQLRLTPLRPAAYVATKVLVAMTVALVAVVVELGVGTASGVTMPVGTLLLCGLAAWGCSAVFAVFGLFMGYMLPSENVMQVLGPVLGALSFLGGLFVPVSSLGRTMARVAELTPVYGVGVVARAPLPGEALTAGAVVSVVVWTALFAAGAVRLFRRDTARG